jgi:hypothetical membrane protein
VNKQQIGGTLIFIGALEVLVMLTVMEAMVPGYSVATNFVSDLGDIPATASIFTTVMVINGCLTLAGAILAREVIGKHIATLMGIIGICTAATGIFPENFYPVTTGSAAQFGATGLFHMTFAFVMFICAIAVMILAYRLFNPPFAYVSVVLGGLMFITLIMMIAGLGGIGRGGMERVTIYPFSMWAAGLGTTIVGFRKRS